MTSSDRDPVDIVAEEFATRVRSGEYPSVTEYVQQYPDLEVELRAVLPGVAMLEQLAQQNKQEFERPPSAVDADMPVPDQIGDFRIVREIGRGGMGVVYKATDETLNRLVAIKTLKSLDIPHELVDTFLEEARAMARLNHENVIQVYDVGQIDNRPFFVMEYLTGQTLSQRMAKVKLDISFACYIFLKILDAVNAVHRIGLVHRDIKPDNIMLSLDGKRCHLLDLGLADELCEKRDTKKRLSGTPGYIAPERLKGYPADYRSDFFSLGCVAYELLCGKRAFNRGSTKSIMHSMEVFDQETANWGNVPDALRQLVIQMLNYDRSERATDYAEISRIVEKVMDDQRGEPAVTPDS